jgi:hypothetical protein
MGATGQAIVTFGAFPGTDIASLASTGQSSILGTSLVEAYLDPTAADTAEHSSDEHLVADIDVRCSALVAGTGFTINLIGRDTIHYGHWNVIWVWV